MVTHIVWWTMKPEAEGRTGAENAKILKALMVNLVGKIPPLLDLKVGLEFLPSTTEEVQLVLVSTHNDMPGLKAYVEHPEHMKVGATLKLLVASRKAIDFIA